MWGTYQHGKCYGIRSGPRASVTVCLHIQGSGVHLRRLGRKRKDGNRPQRKPPTCEMCDVPLGVLATVAMKKDRKASIISARMMGLRPP